MKKLSFFIALLLSSIIYYSCETDVSINDHYEDIAIVYGILNPLDDTTFIKVNKAFLGDGNAILFAQVEDSSSYNDIEVTLIPFENSNNDEPITLEPISVNNKEDGMFYNPHQIVYYTTEPLNIDRDYRLRVLIGDKEVTAETELVQNFSISKPASGGSYINFTPGYDGEIEWTTPRGGKRYETKIRFNYLEITLNYADTIARYFDWVLPSTTSKDADGGDELISVFDNDQFYVMVADKVPYADQDKENTIMIRFAHDIEFFVAVAGDDLNTYIEVNEPSNSIVQDRPEYTNIVNGIGIFSSRYMKKRVRQLHAESYELLDDMEIKFDFNTK